jgi:hypothetical protein
VKSLDARSIDSLAATEARCRVACTIDDAPGRKLDSAMVSSMPALGASLSWPGSKLSPPARTSACDSNAPVTNVSIGAHGGPGTDTNHRCEHLATGTHQPCGRTTVGRFTRGLALGGGEFAASHGTSAGTRDPTEERHTGAYQPWEEPPSGAAQRAAQRGTGHRAAHLSDGAEGARSGARYLALDDVSRLKQSTRGGVLLARLQTGFGARPLDQRALRAH